ncbi:hypothetical protein E8E12_003889 [Didymella heteroderae]|uniref:Uncharacterized protein n=1 Tax=Didymella heteroderae TaxID=1769908 RepID=A0A9P4WQQ2_9PLEO|nr:hypothetical protein E8E12_003889 [Didymella heteroderae]
MQQLVKINEESPNRTIYAHQAALIKKQKPELARLEKRAKAREAIIVIYKMVDIYRTDIIEKHQKRIEPHKTLITNREVPITKTTTTIKKQDQETAELKEILKQTIRMVEEFADSATPPKF